MHPVFYVTWSFSNNSGLSILPGSASNVGFQNESLKARAADLSDIPGFTPVKVQTVVSRQLIGIKIAYRLTLVLH